MAGSGARRGKNKDKTTEAKAKQFDVSTDYSDHKYRDGKKTSITAKSCVHNKIMQEWKILEEHLPDSIFVQVYEDRIDLLRAVIIGASGTPYEDGLFFFDMKFPFDYPENPPTIYYHAHGLRLNPNLYSNGYVCLSLLNTWGGSAKEKWDPCSSTILQVLLSLQALVLNEEPYYNEPGRENMNRQSSHYKAISRNYNKEVFLFSCKTVRYVIQNPPKGFEAFVVDHFCKRANFILANYMTYVSNQEKMKFDSSVDAVYSNLVDAFGSIGASVEEDSNGATSEQNSKQMATRKSQRLAAKKRKKCSEGKEEENVAKKVKTSTH